MQPQKRQTVQIKLDYEPFDKQRLFHDSEARMRLASTGIRAGKTYLGVFEAIRFAHRGWNTFGVPNVGCVVSPTYRMLFDIIIPIFDKHCPKEVIAKFNKTDMTCHFKNGSKILFRSAEYPDRLRGLDLHWFWLDEAREMKSDIFEVMLGRIAQREGCGYLTTTTKGYNWVYDKVMKPFYDKTDPDMFVIHWTSHDNPFFPEKEIDRLKKLYGDDFYRQEVMGEVVKFSGIIYKDFSRFTHVKSFETDNLKYFISGVDFGFLQPATLLIGFDSDGNVYICDEWYESEQLNSALIHNLKLWNEKTKLEILYCDPADPGAIKELQAAGLNAVAADNAVMHGINKVNEFIKPGRLFIHPRCVNLIKELEVYHFREGTEVPLKVMDHACFPAGTMITIKGGDKPIEKVKAGDMALTRKGYRKVLVSGMTEHKANLVRIRLFNGATLRCTTNHPIFVWHGEILDGEFIRADSVKQNDKILFLSNHSVIADQEEIAQLTRLSGSEPVYNLEVDSMHEYFANGLLSRNCDALRYALVGPKKEQEVIEESTDYAITF